MEVSSRAGPEEPWTIALGDVEYDADGNVLAATYGNGAELQRSYEYGRLDVLGLTAPNGTPLVGLDYYREPAIDLSALMGQVTRIRDRLDPAATLSLDYDDKYRLSQVASAQTGTIDYVMTHDGAMLQRGDWDIDYAPVGAATSHAPIAAENVSTGELRTFAYNASGYVLSDGERTFDYDPHGQLIRIAVEGAEVESFFDANGLLVRRIRREMDPEDYEAVTLEESTV